MEAYVTERSNGEGPGAGDYTLRSQLDGNDAVAIGIFQAPGANALAIREQVVATMDELATQFPTGVEYEAVYDTTIFVSDSIKAVVKTLLEAVLLVVLVVTLFSANLARLNHSAVGGASIGDRYLRGALSAGILDQHADPIRAGVGHRHCGR